MVAGPPLGRPPGCWAASGGDVQVAAFHGLLAQLVATQCWLVQLCWLFVNSSSLAVGPVAQVVPVERPARPLGTCICLFNSLFGASGRRTEERGNSAASLPVPLELPVQEVGLDSQRTSLSGMFCSNLRGMATELVWLRRSPQQ